MPKRMIDGEALWTSGKLSKVVPAEWRAHYANWIPMAEINGVFEADPFLIHYKVYAFLFPEFRTENVQEILDEFKRVDLIRTWESGGKTWGYFVGMEKPGRLPFPSQVARGDYKLKLGIPNPPKSLIEQDTSESQDETKKPQDRFRLGLGLGLGIGLGEEEFVSFKSNITDKAREILGTRISPQDRAWEELRSIARSYGRGETEDAFEDWANTRRGETLAYPLSEFVKVADGLLRGISTVITAPEAKDLVNDLVFMCNGEITFDQKQQIQIGKMLQSWNEIDIKSAFIEFYGQIEGDDFALKFGAKNFVEKAEQLLTLQKRRQDDARKQDELTVRIMNEQREQAEKEIAAAQKQQNYVDSLVEDTLGG